MWSLDHVICGGATAQRRGCVTTRIYAPTLKAAGPHSVAVIDMEVFNESGQGYWMPGFGCLRAEGENRPSRPSHVIVLNEDDKREPKENLNP